MDESTRTLAEPPGARQQITVPVGVSETELVRTRSAGFDHLTVAGGTVVGEVGWPALPARLVMVALPVGCAGVQAHLVGAQWRTLPEVIRLPPVQPPRKATASGYGPDRTDPQPGIVGRISAQAAAGHTTIAGIPIAALAKASAAGRRTPALTQPPPLRELSPLASQQRTITAPVQVVTSGHLAGVDLVTVRVPLARYTPGPGRLDLLVAGELQVSYIPGPPQPPPPPLSPLAAWYDAQLLSTLPIAGSSSAAVGALRRRVSDPRMARFDIHLINTVPISWWLLEGEFPYVIITDDVRHTMDGTVGPAVSGMSDAFARVARWKTAKGLRARVVTVSDILANRYGPHRTGATRDVAEAVRNFCKTAYRDWHTRWVLIGGDLDIVPIRHVLANFYWYYVADDTSSSPGDEKRYYVSGATTMRYRPGEAVTTAMVLVKSDDATAITYRPGATATSPGWYFVTDDWSTASTTPTRNIIVAAPAAWFAVAFTRAQYLNQVPTDVYYSSVANPTLYSVPGKHDWDLDGNGVYGFDAGGNPDGFELTADISVGRAPVRTAVQANAWIDKLLSYETFHDVASGAELDGDFPHRLVAVGGVWGSGWSDDSPQRIRWGDMDGASADKDTAIATLRSSGADVDRIRRFLGDGYFAQNRCDLVEMSDAMVPMLRDAFNWGPAYVTVSGHGWWDGCSWLSSVNPDFASVEAMTNGMHAAVWFVDSCLTNEIDHHLFPPDGAEDTEPCLGKHLIARQGGGAVAYLGYTRECEVGNSREQLFWGSMSYPSIRRVGPMADRMRVIGQAQVGTYQVLLATLLGDPEMAVRTRTPATLDISFPAVVYGNDQLTVEVFRQDAPVLDWNLQVAVSTDGPDPDHPVVFDLVSRQDNRFTFDTRHAADGTLTICASAPDTVPLVCFATKVSTPVSDAARHVGGVVSAVTMAGAHLVAGTSDGLVMAMDPITLAPRWSYSLPGEVLGLVSAPDGSVLAGARVASGTNLVLLDVMGAPVHTWATGQNVYALARDPARNLAYAGLDGVGIAAFRTTDGAPAWTGGGSACIGLAVAPDGRVLATGGDSGGEKVYCYQSDGTLAWSYVIDTGTSGWWAMALAVTNDGTCWAASRDAKVYRISSIGTGAALPLPLAAPAISLLPDGAHLLVGCGDGVTKRLAGDGSEIWSTDVGERVESLIAFGGRTYAGCWTKVQALSAAGEQVWARLTNATVLGQATTGSLISGAHLYAGTRDGWVYRIEIGAEIIWATGTSVAVAAAAALAATGRISLDTAAMNRYLAGKPVLPLPGPGDPARRVVPVG